MNGRTNGQRKKSGARRRVKMRSALLLTLWGAMVTVLWQALRASALAYLPDGTALLLDTLACALAWLMPAALGLLRLSPLVSYALARLVSSQVN